MARLNLTIPDPLYERLDRVRDRVNVSKICATALEKELDMIDGQPKSTDPRVARLLERLGSKRGLWYQRGHDDAIAWASDNASRRDLEIAATDLADLSGRALLVSTEEDAERLGVDWNLPPLPGLDAVDFGKALGRWLENDLGRKPKYGEEEKVADSDAYAEGWRDALKELWQTLVPVLR